MAVIRMVFLDTQDIAATLGGRVRDPRATLLDSDAFQRAFAPAVVPPAHALFRLTADLVCWIAVIGFGIGLLNW